MSRRGFVKWLLAGSLLLFGGLGTWLRELLGLGASSRETNADPSSPAAPPSPAAIPEKGKLLALVFLFSDMHINMDQTETSDKLRLALTDVTSLPDKTDAIVLGGDLTDWGRDGDYRQLQNILNGYKLPPLYGNMGNHDYYHVWLDRNGRFAQDTVPNGKTDEASRSRFLSFMRIEKPYRDVWINGVHLIMVSQETYVEEKPDVKEGAWYSDEQMEWLKRSLASHRDGKPALLFIHQPLPAPGTDGGTHRLIRANEFRVILKPYKNVFVFSGHTHQNFTSGSHYSKETFHWFVNASVGRTRAGSGGGAQNPSQGMRIQVYEGAVVVNGREFSDKTWIDAASWDIPLKPV